MTEERATYATDEVTQLRRQNRELSEKLGRQIAAWNGGTDALTAHAHSQTQRIAELEAGFNAARRVVEMQLQTIARLEAEKRRLIAQIPYEDLRYIINSHPNLRVDLRIEAKRWLDTVKVQHD